MRIFYDVDTQNDFMNKDGALYVPDAELIKPNLILLTDFARKNKTPVVGSVDRHFGTEEYREREGELARWSGRFPNHCIDGTVGQGKIEETKIVHKVKEEEICFAQYVPHDLERKDIKVIYRELSRMWRGSVHGAPSFRNSGIYFEKQSYDVFTNPATEILLRIAGAKEAVVYGVATDFCVRTAVLGMQKRKIQCYVVEDAIKGVSPDKSREALEEMARAGAKLVTTKDVLEGEQFHFRTSREEVRLGGRI